MGSGDDVLTRLSGLSACSFFCFLPRNGVALNWRVGCARAGDWWVRLRIEVVVGALLAFWADGRICGLKALAREERSGDSGRMVVVVGVRMERERELRKELRASGRLD